jgi:hypothetical protein
MILKKMKIAENEEQRYGIAGHVGQLSFDDTLENWPDMEVGE